MAGWPSGRDETEEMRLDRNLGEPLRELCVDFPGVQSKWHHSGSDTHPEALPAASARSFDSAAS